MGSPKWVGQCGPDDCSIAAVACALGIKYEEADAAIGGISREIQATRNDADTSLRAILCDDYELHLKMLAMEHGKRVILVIDNPQTPTPGSVYIASIKSDYVTGKHAVVVDRDGLVIDPNNKRLRVHWSKVEILRLLYQFTDES
jgi:hypothetical protein